MILFMIGTPLLSEIIKLVSCCEQARRLVDRIMMEVNCNGV